MPKLAIVLVGSFLALLHIPACGAPPGGGTTKPVGQTLYAEVVVESLHKEWVLHLRPTGAAWCHNKRGFELDDVAAPGTFDFGEVIRKLKEAKAVGDPMQQWSYGVGALPRGKTQGEGWCIRDEALVRELFDRTLKAIGAPQAAFDALHRDLALPPVGGEYLEVWIELPQSKGRLVVHRDGDAQCECELPGAEFNLPDGAFDFKTVLEWAKSVKSDATAETGYMVLVVQSDAGQPRYTRDRAIVESLFERAIKAYDQQGRLAKERGISRDDALARLRENLALRPATRPTTRQAAP
jgi:hypothetical protein